ncbi:hypothetical protein Tco_1571062 [Tanacetum coccineum]
MNYMQYSIDLRALKEELDYTEGSTANNIVAAYVQDSQSGRNPTTFMDWIQLLVNNWSHISDSANRYTSNITILWTWFDSISKVLRAMLGISLPASSTRFLKMRRRSDPLGFVAFSFKTRSVVLSVSSPNEPKSRVFPLNAFQMLNILKGTIKRTQGYVGNAGNNQATGARVVNPVRNAGAKQLRVIKSQEAGVILNEEQQDFLANSLEETDDYEDLQLQATTNFEVDHVDAYDLDYDDKATTNAIFMANLSPVDSINDDMVDPRYDSDILFEVPHYDNYHDFDMLNSNIQELGYIENIVSNNESYDELTSNINVISYTDYMLTFGNDDDNYVPPPLQKNDMMLSVIEQIKSQVEKCNMLKTAVLKKKHI